ncbi:MAG: 50S ribosomal protein L10 [Rhodospirillaceae bacterium]|nr:50S ribosomal protein L10 [Rhodospirillaceae bacterium]
MALNLAQKKALVADVNAVAASSLSAVIAEYRGLTVAEMTDLRTEARNAGVYMKVVKNSLARRAVEGTPFECIQPSLRGPLLLAFSREDPGSAARVVKGFSKDHSHLVTVSVAVGGELYDAANLDRVAALPNLDEARAMLLRTLNGPMTQLVRLLSEPGSMLARALQGRGEQAE